MSMMQIPISEREREREREKEKENEKKHLEGEIWCMQVTCQDISTMIRINQPSLVFLMNNGGYTIEVEIHDGPYNVIKNWNYIGLVEAFTNGDGNIFATRVSILTQPIHQFCFLGK